MRKIVAFIALLSLILALTVKVQAANHRSFSLPPQAKQIAPNVYDLGTATDNGRQVQGLAILHPKADARNQQAGAKKGGVSPCYTYIGNKAKWKMPEDYLVDPANLDNLDPTAISNNITTAMNTWETPVAPEIFGNEMPGVVDGLDTSSTDGKNEIMFGTIDPDTIGVTIVWYIPALRQIVEYDQMYNDFHFDWSVGDPAEGTKMDFLNIATHELGHSAGLGDLYTLACTEETMYGYAANGETKKRDLNAGDIAGIKSLYK